MLAISFGAVGPDDINLLIPGYDLVYDFKEFLLFVFLAEAVFNVRRCFLLNLLVQPFL